MTKTTKTPAPSPKLSEGVAEAIANGEIVHVETADDVLAVLNAPKAKRIRKAKVRTVSARTISAYRAHRTMIAKRMKGSSKSVRTELAAKLAES